MNNDDSRVIMIPIRDRYSTYSDRLRVIQQTDSHSNINVSENSQHPSWQESAGGLRYCHERINANTGQSLENASFLYAMIELLAEKGVITVEELDDLKKSTAERLVEKFKRSGIGLVYQEGEQDKYEFEHESHVDCANRTHICKAVCCKFPFALSKQDVEEGKIKWDFHHPYMIAHDEEGYCVHLDRETFECTVRDHRPIPCRACDCRDNKKWQVWLNFEGMEINQELLETSESRRNHKPRR